MTAAIIAVETEVKGEAVTVSGLEGFRCQACNSTAIKGERMPEFMRLASDHYRRSHGLLTSADLRSLRKSLGMSQAAFATFIGAGIASVKRWEMGQVQDRAMDNLIRLKVANCTVRSEEAYDFSSLSFVQTFAPQPKMRIEVTDPEEILGDDGTPLAA